MPLLDSAPCTEENRFGVSLQQIRAFIYRMTHTIRNGQAVRPKYEVEWQTPEQSQKANAFLYEVLNNRAIINQAASRTELRPIPAQWKHLMKKLKQHKVFHDYIQTSHCKLELSPFKNHLLFYFRSFILESRHDFSGYGCERQYCYS